MQTLTKSFLTYAQAALGRIGLATEAAHVGGAPVDTWELGELAKMFVLQPDAAASDRHRFGHVSVIDLSGEGVQLRVSRDQSQIYCVGGRQRLDLTALSIPKDAQAHAPVVIGPVERVTYMSERSGERLEYQHMFGYEFGSDYSELPVLMYDPFDRRITLEGGVYKVGRVMGIVC